MKVSVSLPAEDVAYLDEFARRTALGSRSAALQRAVRLLRTSEMGEAYAVAWREWTDTGEAGAWETTVADGLRS